MFTKGKTRRRKAPSYTKPDPCDPSMYACLV